MGAKEALQAYLLHLQFERGLSDRTVYNALSVQRQWESWLGCFARPRGWLEATAFDLQGFLSARQGLSDQTTNLACWHIKSLYRWAFREGLTPAPLGQDLAMIGRPRPRRAKLIVSQHQMEALLRLPDRGTVEGIRDQVIMEVLYATGVRAHELLNLQLHHVWPKERRVVVWGKGNKERLVVLSESAAKWLTYYLREIHPRLLRRRRWASIPTQGDQYLFPSTKLPQPLSYGWLRQRLHAYGHKAGLPSLTAHVFRHAFATHLYQGGADMRSIQMLMGHSSITTTANYTAVVTEHLRQLVERHHPRGHLYPSAHPLAA